MESTILSEAKVVEWNQIVKDNTQYTIQTATVGFELHSWVSHNLYKS